MIEVYAYPTPNSIKVLIALEELSLHYRLHAINVKQGQQRQPAFLALNPNAKIPVLVEHDAAAGTPRVITESAAILVHLAERAGRLLPTDGEARIRTFEQLFFHASALSPSYGNAGFFTRLASEPQALAQRRFHDEALRVTALLDRWLGERRYSAGDDYGIADIAHFGWLWRREFAGVELQPHPNLARWYAAIERRPAVQRAIERIQALAASA